MTKWRILAALLGMSLMIGETVRSWGQGRHLLFVLDDFFIGIPLVACAALMSRPTAARHRALCASYAASSAMLYGSFFSKLVDPTAPMSSNMDVGFLTILVGVAFALSLVGLFGTLRNAPGSVTPQ